MSALLFRRLCTIIIQIGIEDKKKLSNVIFEIFQLLVVTTN